MAYTTLDKKSVGKIPTPLKLLNTLYPLERHIGRVLVTLTDCPVGTVSKIIRPSVNKAPSDGVTKLATVTFLSESLRWLEFFAINCIFGFVIYIFVVACFDYNT
jgi:hypothetical protein